MEVSVYHMITN